MQLPLPQVPELMLFMALVLVICVAILAVSGHFPQEYRGKALTGPVGRLILWGTILVIAGSGLLAVLLAYASVPWYAAVIGGGLMVLVAPFVLQPFGDGFVNGRGVLLLLSAAALGLDVGVWRVLP